MTTETADAAIEQSLRALCTEAGDAPRRTRHIRAGHAVLAAVPSWLEDHRPATHDIVVCDANTREAAGDALAAALQGAGRDARLCVLEVQPGHDELVCDDEVIDRVLAVLGPEPSCNAVAVGAGTINDIVKMATARLERPYQAVATAASMNGYTSAIAAVLSKGVKRTLPAQQPEAVFADIGVIAKAPARLNLAGFGDLLSKPYSNADWLLSHFVRGVEYHERPARLLDDAYELLLERASAIGQATPEGIGTLTRAILLSGFTMAIAGTSAPASGGEHLVSHYWDMERHCQHQPLLALHGTQVGIATRLVAILFEAMVALEPGDIDPERAVARRPDDAWLAELGAMHPELTEDVVAEVRAQIGKKQRHGATLRDELATLRPQWTEIRAALDAVLIPASRMKQALQAAGAPDRPSAIGVDRDHAVATLRVCRHIRSRYVALDLLDDLGYLHDWAAAAVDTSEN